MNYKPIPGFEDKFEIGEDGTVRGIKYKKTTAPYRTSQTEGPFVRLEDRKTDRDVRISVLKVVYELFGHRLKGWTEIDPDTI